MSEDKDRLIGLENILGKRVLEDPRVRAAFKDIEMALENYEAVLIIVATEAGLVKDKTYGQET
jgi:hypothetical protein